MVRTLSSACRLQHWDPGSPSSRVPAFLLARSKINLLRLADASGARLETCRGCAGPPGPDLAKRDLNPRIPARVRTI